MKGITGAPYRARCDGLTVTDVSWLPYTEHRGIDDRWMQFADHLLPAGQLCLVPGQVSADYMEWFFRISHSFMIPTQEGDQPRDAPAADPEDYIQPPSPQVRVAFDPPPHVDDYEGYEAIA
eukprot:XP_014627105.1 uncharacterized protein LOC106797345 [Glycine max]